jgi:N-acetylglucosamine-6-phosphate deacetylase
VILLSGADVVLPDRVAGQSTLVLDGDRITDVVDGARQGGASDRTIDLSSHIIVPGFIDVHVHGVEGFDTQVQADAIVQMSTRLPRHGVTAFCPTSIACSPSDLRTMLSRVRDARFASVQAGFGPPREQLHQPRLQVRNRSTVFGCRGAREREKRSLSATTS